MDESYRQLLEDIVGNPVMVEFQKEAASDFVEMYRIFETKKRNIKNDTKDKVTIKIPQSLVEIFEVKTNKDIKIVIDQTPKYAGKVSLIGDKCKIKADMIKDMFNIAGKQIINHVRELLLQPSCDGLDKMIMVGGFSESPILQHLIRENFKDMRIIIPPEAGLAVLKGAVIYGHEPKTIAARKAKRSYGIATTVSFDPSKHPISKKKEYKDGTGARCKDIFSKHVTKGDTLNFDEVQSEKCYQPVSEDQTAMTLKIYTSTEDDPKFVTENSCTFLGRMEVDMSDTTGGTNRNVICKMRFGGTELEVEALETNTNKVSKVKLNFLK